MKIIRNVYMFSDTHLPERGWLQGCYKCGEITSRTITYKTKTKYLKIFKFIVHLCPRCQRQLKDNTPMNVQFIHKCDAYILDY
jgi:hypothetical protein